MNSTLKMFNQTLPVLVIDDCPMYRTAAKGMLQKLGFKPQQIEQAQDADIALRLCRTKRFQLVLCDYNLGKNTNGHQLLDEIKHKQLLPADCVVIVVTGDATAEVVRGFAELEPDGYLVKPLNFKILSERLPKMAKRKRSLGELLNDFSQHQYESTIDKADEAVFNAVDMANGAQLIKAKALIELNKLDEARNLLIYLLKGPDKTSASLELARLALRQKQYKMSQSLLGPLEADPMNCAAALQLSAEVLLEQQLFDLALEKITTSVEKSPKNIERHLLRSKIALSLFDFATASQAATQALRESQHSYKETAQLHQYVAQITLDIAQFASKEDKPALLSKFTNQCKVWRSKYQQKHYKTMECLLLARANGINGLITKSRAYLQEYKNLYSQDDAPEPVSNELLELAKVNLILSDVKSYESMMNQVSCKFNHEHLSSEDLAFSRFISLWRARVEAMAEQAKNLLKEANHAIDDKNYEKATTSLVQAIELDRADDNIPRLLMHCLTHSWPIGWSKKEVGDLAKRCKAQLLGSPVVHSAEYKQCQRLLANQLELKELAA